MIKAKLSFELQNPLQAKKAIQPDVENTNRFKVKVSISKKTLDLEIEAKDPVAMRAALNSYTRLINLIQEVDNK